jgi:CRISPR-associated protein Csx14
MAEASIPVDLFNPGQVFACLGFLEAADVLLGDAEGGFDWSDESDVRFRLRAKGDENPFGVVLTFLAQAEVCRCAPVGYNEKKAKTSHDNGDDEEDSSGAHDLRFSESFPAPKGDRMALPILLESPDGRSISVSHWADGSGRDDFKLYAGNRSAASIARAMLRGTRGPGKGKAIGAAKTRGINALWHEQRDELVSKPFDVLTLLGGSFNFDPRRGWTAIDAGFSPDRQKKAGNLNGVDASPVVEMLAALGLEHARPEDLERDRHGEHETRRVRYGAWSGFVSPVLARPALSGTGLGAPVRRFNFVLGGTKHNQVVTSAQEETQA